MKRLIRTNKFRLIGLSFIIMCFYNGYAQMSQGGVPYSFQLNSEKADGDKKKSLDEIPTFDMPIIKQSVIDELKENNSKEQESYMFAYSFDVEIDVKESAIKESIDNGVLYKLAIKSSGAYSVNIIFSEYHIPHGAKLFIYNETCDYVIGAFTSNNNKEDKIFAVSPVLGEKIIIEYFEPYFYDFSGSLVIGRVSHDFLDILNSGKKSELSASGNCNIDVNCSEGNDWQKEKRAVCRILINGNGLCTGALINNTNNDGRAYFLTANHCISTQSTASGCIFYFNYERPACQSGNGSLSQSISGATLRANSNGSDFTLLELSKRPLSTFRPYFAGWDRNNTQNAGGMGIHHPQGDVKKISIHNTTPTQVNFNAGSGTASCWRVIWNLGTTEKGSSGSPLFNSNYRIIGQLYGGTASCSNMLGHDNYGRLDISWTGNNTSTTRLRDWLDPNNTGINVLDGVDACLTGMVVNLNLDNTISSGTYQAANSIESAGTIQSGSSVIYNAGNSITLRPGFHAHAGSQLLSKIENFNCVVVPNPINLVAWTSVACIGSGLHFNITNATNYTIKIYSILGQLIYSGSGSITGNSIVVWSAVGVGTGYYTANITFSSSISGEIISNAYTILVKSCPNNVPALLNKNTEQLLSIQETDNNKFDFTVFPNPSNGNFILQLLDVESMKPYSVQIFNSTGALISKMEYCNANQLNFNHMGLPSGVYYVKLSMGINSVTKKVIIQ